MPCLLSVLELHCTGRREDERKGRIHHKGRGETSGRERKQERRGENIPEREGGREGREVTCMDREF